MSNFVITTNKKKINIINLKKGQTVMLKIKLNLRIWEKFLINCSLVDIDPFFLAALRA